MSRRRPWLAWLAVLALAAPVALMAVSVGVAGGAWMAAGALA